MTKGKHTAGKHSAEKHTTLVFKQNSTIIILVLSSLLSISLITCFGLWIRGQVMSRISTEVVNSKLGSSYAMSDEHLLPSLGDDDAFEATRKAINGEKVDEQELFKVEIIPNDGGSKAPASPSDSVEYVAASYSG